MKGRNTMAQQKTKSGDDKSDRTSISTGMELARMAGMKLLPAVPVLAKVLATIGERKATLEREATKALYDLILETSKTAAKTGENLEGVFQKAFEGASDRQRIAIIEAMTQVGNLANFEGDQKTAILVEVISSTERSRLEEIKATKWLTIIGTSLAGLPALILAIGKAVNIGRKPTMWESIFGKK